MRNTTKRLTEMQSNFDSQWNNSEPSSTLNAARQHHAQLGAGIWATFPAERQASRRWRHYSRGCGGGREMGVVFPSVDLTSSDLHIFFPTPFDSIFFFYIIIQKDLGNDRNAILQCYKTNTHSNTYSSCRAFFFPFQEICPIFLKCSWEQMTNLDGTR